MPKRNRIRTITGGPQGEDATIVLKVPTMGEMRHQGKEVKRLGKESDETELLARTYLSDHTLKWNWVDDEGNPFPQPKSNPDIFADLTAEELQFIGNNLAGQATQQAEDRKNLNPGS